MGLKVVQPVEMQQVDGVPFDNSKYFEYGDYKLHYRIDEPKTKKVRGKMFMIHGFGCSTSFYDELAEEYTAKGFRCVRVDLPDFGFSTRECPCIHYIPRTEMLIALMDMLDSQEKNPDKWIIVGHSMGGSVSLDLADISTEKMKAIMLYAPMFMFNVPPMVSKMFMSKPMAAIMNTALKYVIGYNTLVDIVLMFACSQRRYIKGFETWKAADPFKVKDTGTGLCYMSAHASHPDYSQMDKIDVPVLLVWGGLDLFIPITKVKKLSESLPASTEIRRVWTGGHCLVQTHPEKCAKFGVKFLKKNGLY